MAATPRRHGKPPAQIDLEELRKLGAMQCTIDEAAAHLNCCKRTLIRWLKKPKYKEAWERGQASGRISLRRRQFQIAMSDDRGAAMMAIHLGKHWLGQTERAAMAADGGPAPAPELIEIVGGLPKIPIEGQAEPAESVSLPES